MYPFENQLGELKVKVTHNCLSHLKKMVEFMLKWDITTNYE